MPRGFTETLVRNPRLEEANDFLDSRLDATSIPDGSALDGASGDHLSGDCYVGLA
jgi:hypothetical protein